jgi:hypothetical protein
MRFDTKLIAAVAAAQSRAGFKYLPQQLRFALVPALRQGRADGASVAQLATAYRISMPTVYGLLRTTGNGVFGRVRIARDIALVCTSIQEQAQSHRAEISISIEDPVSGVVARVASVDAAASLIQALRKC